MWFFPSTGRRIRRLWAVPKRSFQFRTSGSYPEGGLGNLKSPFDLICPFDIVESLGVCSGIGPLYPFGDHYTNALWMYDSEEDFLTAKNISQQKFFHISSWKKIISIKAENIYFFYTTCPKCSKYYGENYVVAVAKINT